MKGRSLTKADKARFQALTDMGCIACTLYLRKHTPPEIHHLEGKTRPGAHQQTIPLCYVHHRAGVDDAFGTSRHPHKARFVARYGTEEYLLAEVNARLGQ